MKIDIFSHIMPKKYVEAFKKAGLSDKRVVDLAPEFLPPLFDIDTRFRLLDNFEGLSQVLTLAEPPLENIKDKAKAVELAKVVNDSLAELVDKYPDRFAAAVAALPMSDVDAALKEADRAIKDLKLRGVLLYTSINDKPLDSEEFLPLYEKMIEYDLPIWLHPNRGENYPDYRSEEKSIYGICGTLGWPHETTVAMSRLAFSGLLEKYPTLKFITHHCGGTVPYLGPRIGDLGGVATTYWTPKYHPLTRPPVEYLKMFYGDTATYSTGAAMLCGYEFFGADHMLFGTDMPFAKGEPALSGTRLGIKGVENLPISDAEKEKIFAGNARRLLHLD